jgi:hypothetical protein
LSKTEPVDSGAAPRVTHGERPLMAFVSSVMRPEFQWARDATVAALTRNPTLSPWAFEYTPISSDAADMTYLSKVREADFCIWLVGATTTAPVRNEVAEALSAGIRIWAIMLPATSRDAETTKLISDVRDVAKTGDAADADALHELLALTFSEEVVRALRGRPGRTRLARLEDIGRRSRERMVSRWVAAGLSRALAIVLADDPTIGSPSPLVLPDQARPLSILVGDVGAGKSVYAERALQIALRETQERAGAPIPMFFHARDAKDGLEPVMRLHATQLGDIFQLGVNAVIDGADEIDIDAASHLVEQARELAHALPQTRILITSRPNPAIRVATTPELVKMPLLSDEEASILVGCVSGQAVTPAVQYNWPESIRDAIHRPLFAIAMGLRGPSGSNPQSTGELLAALVEDVLAADVQDQTIPVLKRLATLVTDAQGPVDRGELGAMTDRVNASASRIVREDGGRIDFALPIFAQWFAADVLIASELPVADIAASSPRLDRWRYALSIALAIGPRSFVDSTMETLVSADPAFAAVVVEESFRQWLSSGSTEVPSLSAIEAGTVLRNAIATWDSGIGQLRAIVAPHTALGEIPPLGIAVVGTWLTMGWYRGTQSKPEVSELPADLDFMNPQEWFVRRGGRWHNERGWSWRWGLELCRQNLKRILESRSLRTDNQDLADEALWLVALEAQGQPGSLRRDPISLDLVTSGLKDLDPAKPTRLRDRIVATAVLITRVAELRDSGAATLSPPWPPPDQAPSTGGMIWDSFSPDQQIRRTQAVYQAALNAYVDLTEEWFSALKPRMRMSATLPAVLRGTLRTSAPRGSRESGFLTNSFMIDWYLDPQPSGVPSSAEITMEVGDDPSSVGEWLAIARDRHDKLLRLRPEAAGWISATETRSLADVFQVAPVAPLVYDWLKQDLRPIKWV